MWVKYRGPTCSCRLAEAAVRHVWGCEPLYVREGGTMPVASVLERLLNAPAIMIPMGQSSVSN